jgi:hypothetical protein
MESEGPTKSAQQRPDVAPTRAVKAAEPIPFVATSKERLCVTAGKVEAVSSGQFHVNQGGMRAIVAGGNGNGAELAFTYRGPSAVTAKLADGTLRRQIGLKLRARDTCNVVYVMWHIEPTRGVNVSVKSSPSLHSHEACGATGYVNVKPTKSHPAPGVAQGDRHTLRATLESSELRVVADGETVWEGVLPKEALAFDGPAGIRSDNGDFDFELSSEPRDAFAVCTH